MIWVFGVGLPIIAVITLAGADTVRTTDTVWGELAIPEVVDATVMVSAKAPTDCPAQFTLAVMLPAALALLGDNVSHDCILVALQLSSVPLVALTATVCEAGFDPPDTQE
jgi:hypothetical protein